MVVTHQTDLLKNQVSFEQRQKELDEQAVKEELARKRAKQSPYEEFAQVNISTAVSRSIMLELTDTPSANKLFWFIAQNMDGYNALIASYALFQEALDMSRPTVARGIKILREKGLLYVQKSGTSNVYLLSPNIVWKSWGNNMQYCEFPAKVLLAQSEQYPDAKELFSKQMHRVMKPKTNKNQ